MKSYKLLTLEDFNTSIEKDISTKLISMTLILGGLFIAMMITLLGLILSFAGGILFMLDISADKERQTNLIKKITKQVESINHFLKGGSLFIEIKEGRYKEINKAKGFKFLEKEMAISNDKYFFEINKVKFKIKETK